MLRQRLLHTYYLGGHNCARREEENTDNWCGALVGSICRSWCRVWYLVAASVGGSLSKEPVGMQIFACWAAEEPLLGSMQHAKIVGTDTHTIAHNGPPIPYYCCRRLN